MLFDFIIRGLNKVVGDGTLTDDECMACSNRKGAITSCVPAGPETPSRHLSGKQVPPGFIVVRCDLTEAEAEQFCRPWLPEPQFTWESLNVGADRWRVIVVSGLVRARDGHGGMNEGRGKGFLDAWGFRNQDYLPNRSRGRATIFWMATSRGLWRQLSNSTFAEQSYDQATGEHVIRMDYGAVRPNKDDEVRLTVESCATFVAQDAAANIIDFSITRDQAKALFEEDVQRRLDRKLALRRWRLADAEIDRIAAAGGYEEMSAANFRLHMTDVLDL